MSIELFQRLVQKHVFDITKSKLGFYVLFNSKGHIGTGPRHLPLVGLKSSQR